MLTIHGLHKAYGARILFTDVSIQLDAGKCYGIVGANGSGKSTLLRILAGQEEANDGEVSRPRRARIGVLEQDHFKYESVPIIEVVMMGHRELWQAMQEKEALLARAHEQFDADRYGELEDIVLRHDGYSLEARAAEILCGLNIPTEVHYEPLSSLSGGFKLRALLGQTLAAQPDILLLDEPTNHLDIVSIGWLEGFLREFSGCTAVVSHDHAFLDNVCDATVDVDYERVTLYAGNYTAFGLAKIADRKRMEAGIAKREQEIADHAAFVERFRAKATKARQAQSRAKRMAKLTIDKLPPSSRRHPSFRFACDGRAGRDVLRVEGVSKAFGDNQVLDDVGFTVHRGDRLAVIGPNGIGKSTLLRIATGAISADAGETEWGHGVETGCFTQGHDELRGADRATLMSWLWDRAPTESVGFIRGKLAEVLFTRDDVDKKIAALSGGECARLLFAGLNVRAPNVLVLDEPTNHLDLEGIEALAQGLADYEGTIIFVSHDRWFVSHLATRILEITPEGILDYRDTYEAFIERYGADHLDRAAAAKRQRRR